MAKGTKSGGGGAATDRDKATECNQSATNQSEPQRREKIIESTWSRETYCATLYLGVILHLLKKIFFHLGYSEKTPVVVVQIIRNRLDNLFWHCL